MEACIASARLGRSECARLFAPAILVRPSDLGLMRKSELVEFHERVGRPVSAIGRERDYSVTENPVC